MFQSGQSSSTAPGASPGQVKMCSTVRAHGRKVSLAKRSSERLTLGTFAILISTFQFIPAVLMGEHWPRGSTGRRPVGINRPTKWVFFFWFPLRFSDASSQSGLTDYSPHSNIYRHSFSVSKQSKRFNSTRRIARAGQNVFNRSCAQQKSEPSKAIVRTSHTGHFCNFNFHFSILNYA